MRLHTEHLSFTKVSLTCPIRSQLLFTYSLFTAFSLYGKISYPSILGLQKEESCGKLLRCPLTTAAWDGDERLEHQAQIPQGYEPL